MSIAETFSIPPAFARIAEAAIATRHVPSATYRLQVHANFTFDEYDAALQGFVEAVLDVRADSSVLANIAAFCFAGCD